MSSIVLSFLPHDNDQAKRAQQNFIDRFAKNCFNFELVFKKDGRTNIRTAIMKTAGII